MDDFSDFYGEGSGLELVQVSQVLDYLGIEQHLKSFKEGVFLKENNGYKRQGALTHMASDFDIYVNQYN